jgi:hypothetical protein
MWAQRTAYQSGVGSAQGMSWHNALAYAKDASLAGYRDWRVPSVKELQSLVDYRGSQQAPLEPFPSPVYLPLQFWSSSPYASSPDTAWKVDWEGYVSDSNKGYGRHVRLVRAGRPTGLHPLIVSAIGSGTGTVTSVPPGIDCGAHCSRVYASGTKVSLSAYPVQGSLFSGWRGCEGTDTCEVAMDQARTVTATFDLCISCLPSRGGWRATLER